MRRGLIDVARKTTTTMVVSGSPTPRIGAAGGRRAAVGRRNNNTDDFQTRRLNQMLTVRGMHATRTTAFAADNAEEKIVDVELADEAKNSYLSYAMSVIVGRALPDARDGLKPVHRLCSLGFITIKYGISHFRELF